MSDSCYDPSWPAVVSGRGNGVSVVLRQRCAQCLFDLTIARRGETKHFVVSGVNGYPTLLRIASPSLAIAFSKPYWFATTVSLIDLDSGKLLDEFTAYRPSISPNAQNVAFIQYYPPHGLPAWFVPSDNLEVYDVAKAAKGQYPRDTWNRGPVIYPPQGWDAHRVYSDIRWTSDASFSYLDGVNNHVLQRVSVEQHGRHWLATTRKLSGWWTCLPPGGQCVKTAEAPAR